MIDTADMRPFPVTLEDEQMGVGDKDQSCNNQTCVFSFDIDMR